MNIILDSNALFSALIKNSVKRKLILEYEGTFLFPGQIFIEIEKYKDYLLKKSKMNSEEFNDLLQLLLEKVLIIPNEALDKYINEAWELIKEHSPEDAMFIACGLAHENSILWSDDKRLKLQNKVKVLNTKEIIKIISNNSNFTSET